MNFFFSIIEIFFFSGWGEYFPSIGPESSRNGASCACGAFVRPAEYPGKVEQELSKTSEFSKRFQQNLCELGANQGLVVDGKIEYLGTLKRSLR